MKAQLLINERFELDDMAFADVLLWQVPAPVLGSTHLYKYSLAFVVDGECVLRYDNEAGKGDRQTCRGAGVRLSIHHTGSAAG